MKREELTQIGLDAQAVDKVLALYGRDVEKHKAAAEGWRQKYDTDTEALRREARETAYDAAAQSAMRPLRFTSESAKKVFDAELKAAQLPLENGALTGFDAFARQWRDTDPAAFAPDADEAAKTPVAVAVRPAQGAAGADAAAQSSLRRAFGL